MIALYVLGAILVLLLVGVMLAPLLEDARPAMELDELPPRERREAALEALRDVEFEHETGKLDEAEYRRLRTHFGRAVLEAEEAMAVPAEPSAAGEPGADAGGQEAADAPVLEAAYCTACGGELRAGARYCPACGEPRPGAGEEAGQPGGPGDAPAGETRDGGPEAGG